MFTTLFFYGGCGLTATFGGLPLLLGALAHVIGSKPSKTSALYVGRVWHTRFRPTKHAFTYPIFMVLLDGSEQYNQLLFPLSWLARFRTTDHGKPLGGKNDDWVQSILDLCRQRTDGSFAPTKETHTVLLLTHLSYYGYCFNPVSFYYIVNQRTNTIECMCGEVSNTPWNEMHLYVLHKDSVDQVTCPQQQQQQHHVDDRSHRYIFPKSFHVSPFMEMHYQYDWSFSDLSDTEPLVVTNSLTTLDGRQTQFVAKLSMKKQPLSGWNLAWQLARYPMFCVLIQLWIHYQAFWLFLKGVAFQPHPRGSETTASRVIGTLMRPFFAMQDYYGRIAKPKAKRS